ncbi:GntR family transcriptional regulator [Subtercola lobariae]|uniref:GntR family transcriptional regulator n=1 Tax=Subtercola lobariae TaxID=1588641 RepID=UPI001944DBE8|nr:GntR family transcriptional regulator [Subtercola lobariae]
MTEQVTNELRRSIVAGDLAPGSTFSLRSIADQLHVSFIPVREALRNLEGEGLVITRPGRSAQVTPLDLEDLRAIYRLRGNLEPALARESCLVITDAELDRLHEQAVEYGKTHHSIHTVFEAHHAFHAEILAPAATSWDLRVLNSVWRAAERYIRIGFGKQNPGENTRIKGEHERLIEVFRGRDPDAVAAAVLSHLKENEQSARLALVDEPRAVALEF